MRLARRLLRHLVPVAALAAVATVLPAAAASASVRVTPYFFGMHDAGIGRYPWPQVPYGSIRIWDDGFSWRELQPTSPHTWDQSRLAALDRLVNTLHSHGKYVVLVLGQSPRWASSCPNASGGIPGQSQFYYGTGAGCGPSAAALKYWYAYVQTLAARYRSSVNAFEVWNEMNYPTFWQSSMPQMVQLARTARAAVRQAGSPALVLSPSIGARSPNAPRWLSAFLADGGGRYVDVLNVHGYPPLGSGPEAMVSKLNTLRGVAARYGYARMPMWDTEVGYGLAARHIEYSGAVARGYVARTFLLEASAGISRTFWYAWGDRSYSGLWLMNADGTVNINGVALRTTYGWMAGAIDYGCRHGTSAATAAIWSCRFHYDNGETGLVMWATSGSPVVAAPRGTVRVEGLPGNQRPLHGGDPMRLTQEPIAFRGIF